MMTTPSLLPETSKSLLLKNFNELTNPVYPLNSNSCERVSRFHIISVLSLDPDAAFNKSKEKLAQMTESL